MVSWHLPFQVLQKEGTHGKSTVRHHRHFLINQTVESDGKGNGKAQFYQKKQITLKLQAVKKD